MKVDKRVLALLLTVLGVGIAIYGISMHQRYQDRGRLAERIASIGGEGPPPQTIEGLENAIAAYETQIERYVELSAKTGNYWKILAVRLQDRGLHGEALNALEQAVYYNPEDPTLHYSIGISAGIMAKSLYSYPRDEIPEASGTAASEASSRPRAAGVENRAAYFALAEEAFLRAIELEDRYLRPRHSLGVLYVFELNRPEEALPHLEKCLEISRNEIDTMFVLARAFYMLERYEDALTLYERIITLTHDEQKRIDAQNNRQAVLGLLR